MLDKPWLFSKSFERRQCRLSRPLPQVVYLMLTPANLGVKLSDKNAF